MTNAINHETGRVYLSSAARALRPVRVREDDLLRYTPASFPDNPSEACRNVLNFQVDEDE